MNNTTLLTRKHLAMKLDMNPLTIYKWEKRGLPVVGIGRLKRYDFDAVLTWMQEKNTKKGGEL